MGSEGKLHILNEKLSLKQMLGKGLPAVTQSFIAKVLKDGPDRMAPLGTPGHPEGSGPSTLAFLTLHLIMG